MVSAKFKAVVDPKAAKRRTGGKFEEINYKSGAETVAGLIGGQVEVIVQNPSDIVQHVKAGKMRLLASASPMRWKELPEVPTLRSRATTWRSTPGSAWPTPGRAPALRDRLERIAMAAAEGPQVARIFESAGVDPAPLTGAEYRRKLVQGHESMGAAIKAANLPRMN